MAKTNTSARPTASQLVTDKTRDCPALYGARFCRAVELRIAAKKLRAHERVEIKRLGMDMPKRRPLGFKIGHLYTHVQWMRTEQLPALHEKPTPQPPLWERYPHYRELMCIHGKEGSWTSSTNPIYDGGFQMDSAFQQAYGPEFVRRWGPAYNWPVWAQFEAAERAIAERGFSPWPNTRYGCA